VVYCLSNFSSLSIDALLTGRFGKTQGALEEQRPDDGLLEVMGLKDGWHSAFVLLEVSTAVRLCQVSALTYLKFLPSLTRQYLLKEESDILEPM